VNGIGFLVGDFDAEFFLNCHDHFNGIQAIQSKVILKVRRSADLLLKLGMLLPAHGEPWVPLMRL
jgi:hypothetical protein